MKFLKSKFVRFLTILLFVFSIAPANFVNAAALKSVTLVPENHLVIIYGLFQDPHLYVSGYVKDTNGKPIPNVLVKVYDNNADSKVTTYESGYAKTDSKGKYIIPNAEIYFYNSNWLFAATYDNNGNVITSNTDKITALKLIM